MTFEIFMKSLRFETPWVRNNGFYESVCLSVGRVRYNSPIKIEVFSTSFVFLENQKFQYWFLIVPINLY